MRVKFVLVNTLLVVLRVEGYLSLGARTRCGDHVCEAAQYCNSLTGGCSPCEEICEDSHNQQPDQCWKECQDYLHDKLYVSRSEMHMSTDQGLKGSIATLQLLITISLVVSCVVLVLLFMILMFLIRPSICRSFKLPLHKKDAKMSLPSLNTVVHSSPSQKKKNVTKNNNNGKELKLDVSAVPPPPPPSATTTPGQVATPATTSTPLSSRHPAEDNTLEYAAYDNPALAPSPIPRQESSF